MADSFDLLMIEVQLTKEGDANYMKVLEAIFMHINALKKEGIQDHVFDELKKKYEMDFKFSNDKKSSLETANDLGKKMPYDHNMTEILEINRKHYRYDSINKEDIINRLNLLTADNMFAIFHSKNHKKLRDKDPKAWKTDHYYSKSFSIEKLSNETIKNLNEA